MRWLAVALLLLGSAARAAEQQLGGYTVHYIAQNVSELSPEIAQQYGIDRLPRVAMVLVNVRNHEGKPVVAVVTGKAQNLLGESQDLVMKKITEGAAVSYIGLFEISNLEIQNFNLEITPVRAKPLQLKFSQQFFLD